MNRTLLDRTLLERPVAWLSAQGPEAPFVLGCRGSLVRNLADLPFPPRCSVDERLTVEERVVRALDSAGLLSRGRYWPFSDLEPRELLFLIERHLLPQDYVPRGEGCGVYVSDELGLSIVVNGQDHIRILGMASGLQPGGLWPRLNATDDTLASQLDYAFDDTWGYQTAAFDEVGTGFRVTAFVHLPALTLLNRQIALEQQMRERRHVLSGAFGRVADGLGDLYALSNQATLGCSEEELAYYVQHTASELVAQEREARHDIMREGLRGLEDRVGRAQGVARGARLLGFDEAVAVLSSLRLGISEGVLDDYNYECLNNALMAAQRGHLEVRMGRDCDELTLSMERADLFRARLA